MMISVRDSTTQETEYERNVSHKRLWGFLRGLGWTLFLDREFYVAIATCV
jgi:hypothetical protein